MCKIVAEHLTPAGWRTGRPPASGTTSLYAVVLDVIRAAHGKQESFTLVNSWLAQVTRSKFDRIHSTACRAFQAWGGDRPAQCRALQRSCILLAPTA